MVCLLDRDAYPIRIGVEEVGLNIGAASLPRMKRREIRMDKLCRFLDA